MVTLVTLPSVTPPAASDAPEVLPLLGPWWAPDPAMALPGAKLPSGSETAVRTVSQSLPGSKVNSTE